MQAQSSGPAFPVTGDVIDHLLQVGEGLMKNELHVYEQGTVYDCMCMYHIGRS